MIDKLTAKIGRSGLDARSGRKFTSEFINLLDNFLSPGV